MLTTLVLVLFVTGYLFITLEHATGINKTAPALMTGVLCWTFYMLFGDAAPEEVVHQLGHHLQDIAGILFFLLGAMTIVELVDTHGGFKFITGAIRTKSKRRLLWLVALLSFFLSALLDNMTTAIVMASIARKLLPQQNDRLLFGGVIVIAANAGGAWSPIGDVTTTMLWISGQITTWGIVQDMFLPSLAALLIPLAWFTFRMMGTIGEGAPAESSQTADNKTILFLGVGGLLFVPVFKTATHLPPYMGMLLVLSVLWVFTAIRLRKVDEEKRSHLSVSHVLKVIDTPSVLFFLGILTAVAALQSMGILRELAAGLDAVIGNLEITLLLIGLLSAVVDNVPLVAAVQGMYDLNTYPTDDHLWKFLAYCAGTGGSLLVIGSAAGVAIMGPLKLDFFRYARRIALPGLAGYLAGAGVYLLLRA